MADTNAQYTTGNLLESILRALQEAGRDPDQLSPDDLAGFEEFHTLGRSATVALADAAGLAEGDEVLDVGCGIGGPARVLARSYGCAVTGVDLTEEYCLVAKELNRRCGLDDKVRIEVGNALALPFPDASFDVVWTQHVSMNIEDKATLYRELRRVLRPGGRLAFFDIVAGPVQPIHFPVPWADGPELSFLAQAGEIRELVEAAGFRVVHWEDQSEVGLAFFTRMAAKPPAPSPLGVELLIPNLAAKAANSRHNLEEDRMRLLRCVATAP